VLAAAGSPAVLALLERRQRRFGERARARGQHGLPERSGDGKPGAVADLEQPLSARPAAAREAVAAVLARELDSVFLQPPDRLGSLGGEDLGQVHVGRLMRAAPHVSSVQLGRVVLAESRLDAALGLGGVGGLEGALGDEPDASAGALGRDRGREPRSSASDHEDVEGDVRRHDGRTIPTFG
jgi:hypothetical protein